MSALTCRIAAALGVASLIAASSSVANADVHWTERQIPGCTLGDKLTDMLDIECEDAYMSSMNKLDTKTRKLIIRCLVEGQSIRSTARTADVSKNTVTKLLINAGKACADYQDKALRDLQCVRIQVDEIWSFIYAKEKNVARAKSAPAEAGDVWTWTAICADTKLVPSWRVGDRSGRTAIDFMDDLRPRLANRVQLTSDGHKAYLEAIEGAFGGDVD